MLDFDLIGEGIYFLIDGNGRVVSMLITAQVSKKKSAYLLLGVMVNLTGISQKSNWL